MMVSKSRNLVTVWCLHNRECADSRVISQGDWATSRKLRLRPIKAHKGEVSAAIDSFIEKTGETEEAGNDDQAEPEPEPEPEPEDVAAAVVAGAGVAGAGVGPGAVM